MKKGRATAADTGSLANDVASRRPKLFPGSPLRDRPGYLGRNSNRGELPVTEMLLGFVLGVISGGALVIWAANWSIS